MITDFYSTKIKTMLSNLAITSTHKLFIAVMLSIATFFLPLAPLAVAVAIAIILDTTFGVAAAIKVKEKITSRKLGQAVLKMFVYQCVLLSVFVIDKFILSEFMARFFEIENIATKVAVLVLLYVELISVNENVYKLTNINFIDSFKRMVNKSRNTLRDADDIGKL